LFGYLKVEAGGQPLSFRTQKEAELLAYLAIHQANAPFREELTELLWPETETETGRNRFRNALYSLRQTLEPTGTPPGSILLVNRTTVQLHPDVEVDVTGFKAALAAAAKAAASAEKRDALLRAASLYQEELLRGFYPEWIVREREHLAQAHLRALRQLTQLLTESGDLEQAIECGRRITALDPLDEEAHGSLMRLYAAAGQPAAVVRQLQELEQALEKELGMAPSESVRELARACEAAARSRNLPSSPAQEATTPENRSYPATIAEDRTDAITIAASEAEPVRSSFNTAHSSQQEAGQKSPRRSLWRRRLAVGLVLLCLLIGIGWYGRIFGPFGRPGVQYTVTDIGTLPGDTQSRAAAINNSGQVVGYSDKEAAHHAFLWDSAHGIRVLPAPSDGQSVAYSINATGQIVGGSVFNNHALIWDGRPGIHDLGRLPGGSGGDALAVNASGQVTGIANTPKGFRAFLWDRLHGMRNLGVLPGWADAKASCGAGGINDLGEVVGGCTNDLEQTAFVWEPNRGMRNLGTLPGWTTSEAAGINNRGEIVGSAADADGKRYPYFYSPATGMQALTPPDNREGEGDALNNRGQVVGAYNVGGGAQRAFVWDRIQGMRDLSSLIPAASGWVLIRARNINDKGQIIGQGMHGNQLHAFLLTPLPSTPQPPLP
jgi:probable HAF family extracellular repeat protein